MSDVETQQPRTGDHPSAPLGASLRVIDETDAYSSTVAGVEIDVVRAGEGVGPNVVLGIHGEDTDVTSVNVGFPMYSHASVADDAIVATVIRSARGHSQWCGVPLERGDVIVYGPGAEHMAHNQPGLGFTFVATGIGHLLEMADGLEIDIVVPERGELAQYRGIPETDGLRVAMDAHIDSVLNDRERLRASGQLLRALVGLLEQPPRQRPLAHGKALDSRGIVHACLDYAEDADRIPSISELCRKASVSERRLREAFVEEFDVPPSRFFRTWALDLAHRRLRAAQFEPMTVTDVAMELGFNHLGRFADQYRQIYGENPSVTLRNVGHR